MVPPCCPTGVPPYFQMVGGRGIPSGRWGRGGYPHQTNREYPIWMMGVSHLSDGGLPHMVDGRKGYPIWLMGIPYLADGEVPPSG